MKSVIHTRSARWTGLAVQGFTLVEMLAVIAIIAVLATMLMPAVAGVRNQGHGATCLNNLRSIGVAQRLYAAEHNGELPGTWDACNTCTDGSYGNYWGNWDYKIISYLGPSPQYGGASRTLYCPASAQQGVQFRPINGVSSAVSNPTYTRTYALNMFTYSLAGKTQIAFWTRDPTWPRTYYPAVEDTDGTIIVGERRDDFRGQGHFSYANLTQDYEPGWHGGKNQYLFVDGHAARLSYSDTWGTGSFGNPRGMWTTAARD